SLPEHMVPAAFVMLDALPLGPSGKVDRRKLPAPEETNKLSAGAPFVPARTTTAEMLVKIWSGVRSVDRIRAHDSFCALGGRSPVGVPALLEVQREGGVARGRKDCFEAPPVAGLGGRTDAALRGAEHAAAPDITR